MEPVYLFLGSVHDNKKRKEMKHMVTHEIDYIVYIMELLGERVKNDNLINLKN